MIKNVLAEAIKQINTYYDVHARLQNNRSFSDNLIKLAEQTATLKKYLVMHTLMEAQDLKLAPLFSPEDKEGLLRLLNECGEKVVNRHLDASSISLLERELKIINDRQKIGWNHAANSYAKNVVDSLNMMSNLLEDPAAANAIKEDIIEFLEYWPVTEQTVLNFKASVEKGRELLATLPIDNDEIADFLKKLQQQQATVDDLSNEVLEWIRNNNLEGRIKLSIAT